MVDRPVLGGKPIKREILRVPKGSKSTNPYSYGTICAEKIDSYAKTKSARDMNDIFRCLLGIGFFVVRKDYRKLEPFVKEDAVYKIAGDVLLNIAKDPAKYHSESGSFYQYFAWVFKSRMNTVLKDHYENNKRFVCVDEFTDTVLNTIFLRYHVSGNQPVENITKQERYTVFVDKVLQALNRCPRFKHNYQYLAWPLITSMVYESRLFDTLSYRDRTALRVMQCFLTFKIESRSRKVQLAYVEP